LDSDCWMCSSHIRPGRRGMNCKIFIAWDTALIGRLSWVLVALFCPFPSLLSALLDTRHISDAKWIFSVEYCSLPSVRNVKYAAYRGTSHEPAVEDDACKEDIGIRCGMTLDGVGDRQHCPTSKQIRWQQIVA
jgi:hypothetical protein